MKSVEEIIARAECLLCITDRCGLENRESAGVKHTLKQREEQRLIIYKWLKDNGFWKYMTEEEATFFERKIGNIFLKKYSHQKFFECEAIEPLIWVLGLANKLTPYDRYTMSNWQENNEMHLKLMVNVSDTFQRMISKAVIKSEDEIMLYNKAAMLWYWRAIEGKNKLFKTENIESVLLRTFGEGYQEAIDMIMARRKNRQDFSIGGQYVYQLNDLELQHLYKRARWRYYAFEWILTDEQWGKVNLNT